MQGRLSETPPTPSNPADYQINHDPDDVEESKHPENNQKPENSQKLLTGALSSRFLDGKVSDKYLSFPWWLISQEKWELE